MNTPVRPDGVASTSEFGVAGIPEETEDFYFLLTVAKHGNPAPLAAILADPLCARRDAEAALVAGEPTDNVVALPGVTLRLCSSRQMVARLVGGGFLEEIRNSGGDVIGLRFSRQAASGLVYCAAAGCSDEELAEAPEWIRDGARGLDG